jgi:hypothetical protein
MLAWAVMDGRKSSMPSKATCRSTLSVDIQQGKFSVGCHPMPMRNICTGTTFPILPSISARVERSAVRFHAVAMRVL